MLDCLLGISALQTSEYWGSGREPGRLGTAHPRNAPYQGFTAADGDFTVAAGNDRLWAAVADVVGLPELVADPRFVTQVDRVAHQHRARGAAPAAVRAARSGSTGSPSCAPGACRAARSTPSARCSPTRTSRRPAWSRELDVPVAGTTPTVVFPVRIEGQDAAARPRRPGPRRGRRRLRRVGARMSLLVDRGAASGRSRSTGPTAPTRSRPSWSRRSTTCSTRPRRRDPRRWCSAATSATSRPASTSVASRTRPTRRWRCGSCGSGCSSSGCSPRRTSPSRWPTAPPSAPVPTWCSPATTGSSTRR